MFFYTRKVIDFHNNSSKSSSHSSQWIKDGVGGRWVKERREGRVNWDYYVEE